MGEPSDSLVLDLCELATAFEQMYAKRLWEPCLSLYLRKRTPQRLGKCVSQSLWQFLSEAQLKWVSRATPTSRTFAFRLWVGGKKMNCYCKHVA